MQSFKPSDLLNHLVKKSPIIFLIQSFFVLIIIFAYNTLSFNENHFKQKEINFQIMANLNFFEKSPASVKDLYSESIFNDALSDLGLDEQSYSDFYKNFYVMNAKDDVLTLNNDRNIDEIYNAYFAKGPNTKKSEFYDKLIEQITKIKTNIYDIRYNLDKNNNLNANQLISLLDLMNKKINERSQLLSDNFDNKDVLDMEVNMITITSKILHLRNILHKYSERKNFLYMYFDKNLTLIENRFSEVIQSDLKQQFINKKKIDNTILPNNDDLNLIHEDIIALDKQAKKLFSHYEFKSYGQNIIDVISPIVYNDLDSLIKYKKIRDIVILSFNFLLLVILYFIFTFFRKKSY